MSYNNGAVMTAKARRTRGAALVQSTGSAASDRLRPASGGTAINTKAKIGKQKAEMRTDYMVDDHDPLDARQALEAADLMMSQMKGGAR